MIFPDKLDRVCMLKRVDKNVALILLDPNGSNGSVLFSIDDLKELITRIQEQAPEITAWLNEPKERNAKM